ncbi:signal recognition particle-docking protein FtsY [Legionella waltersii]|uniref:Signal recognition particle receptor FtsY n=1 Tax=Legionella waltersii TaxID=66969 RepID=A0A0W1AD69_9GAMM|nr:signal recognition particle-docking protein FtsY [Legionella waltersii]KTD79273.1 cell division membrane protein FtsY [Legionella waltersii]SNV12821.1 cell division membrane protein FtsY [Legionella waltersii]
MIKWFKRNQNSDENSVDASKNASPDLANDHSSFSVEDIPSTEIKTKEGLFARFKKGLSKTRHQLGEGIGRLLLGKKEINPALLDELETMLISADVGLDTSQALLKQLNEELERKQLADGEALYNALRTNLFEVLKNAEKPLAIETEDGSPFVILMVGVNGAGKTTTIGKLAKQFQQQGKKVMLAAGDTFRAAAVEQLQVWGERNQIPVVAQHTGADSASVIFDALQAAKARKIDVLIADTAGRLHTQNNLMEELKKVKRVIQKLDPKAPHETMLVLDASIGQNALSQARQFNEAVQLSGITMTKLDGTAKGGILFAIANELKIPFRYLGVGEGIEDLRPFEAAQFVSAIFDDDHI